MNIVDKVREYLEERSQELATKFYSYIISEFDENPDRVIESPVEQLFYIEWRFREFRGDIDLYLMPQFQDKSTGKYRLDFAIDFIQEMISRYGEIAVGMENPKLGIEIDSHVWHERTKEQVEYHKKRERFLISKGWKLLRFTGSEIYRNPSKCVDETLEVAYLLRKEFHEQIQKKLGKNELEKG